MKSQEELTQLAIDVLTNKVYMAQKKETLFSETMEVYWDDETGTYQHRKRSNNHGNTE